ncbi:MAG: NHLP family bacteriocin export ABC transporter peptidase/permease/ATPase subunit [Actinomycetota bacterium]|nr:NHLP family bacteriocin export ABC transporter peptidase/permease/ATPase subunit [Actinomycetota bacterium]
MSTALAEPAVNRRVKTPTLLQMEATECGAASLGMVLGCFGRIVPLEELREACGISRDGSKAANIMKAARRYGLVPHGWRKEPSQLRAMDLPMIVFWQFNHFLVVEGFRNGKVYLNDPATGPRTVPDEEFDVNFTGIALTFEKGEGFVRGGKRPSLIASLLSRIGRAKSAVAFAVFAGLLLVAPGVAVPALSRAFMDSFLVGQRTNWLPVIVIGMAIAAFVQLVLSWLQQLTMLRLSTKLSVRMSAETIDHLLKLPASFFAQRAPGELAFRSTLNDQVAQALSGPFTQAVLGVLTASFYFVLMAIYDWQLALVVIVIALANVMLLSVSSKARTDLSQRLTRSTSSMSGSVAGGIALIESVKASGGEDDLFRSWLGKLADLIESRQQYERVSIWLTAAPTVLTSLSSAAMLGIGAVQVMDGRITLGTLVAFQALMGGFLSPIGLLVSSYGTVQSMAGNLARLDDVLRTPPDPELDGGGSRRPSAPLRSGRSEPEPSLATPRAVAASPAAPLRGELELVSVTFGYNPLEAPLIEELSLHVQPGQRVALVGASGSGKSTVSRLVAGLYKPWSGEVRFDGKTRSAIDRTVLAEAVAMVDQDILLFDGSIQDNLSLWDDDLGELDLLAALEDASVLEDVLARPGGLRSRVAEGGSNFSGGQRQRLEIARALARNPALLVLDEATSALDPLSEELVDAAIRRRGCTCLIVAHRLSTIRDSDEIIVLERGKVVERGIHDELVAADGAYARLIES